jgi:hypothetical protein
MQHRFASQLSWPHQRPVRYLPQERSPSRLRTTVIWLGLDIALVLACAASALILQSL